MFRIFTFTILSLFFYACANTSVEKQQLSKADSIRIADSLRIVDSLLQEEIYLQEFIDTYFPRITVEYSQNKNESEGFNSPKAINAIATIENDYYSNYHKGISRYYGSVWKYGAQMYYNDSIEDNIFDDFVAEIDSLGEKPKMFHCMVYAMEALKAGLGENYPKVQELHRQIYGKGNYAGWSMAHILVKYFNWDAYVFANRGSQEFTRCKNNFNNKKNYYVWNQPDITIKGFYVLGEQDEEITELLAQHEFGWGFSYQGIHSWITRFTEHKECMWDGAPCMKYNKDLNAQYLFKATPFLEYQDYNSHVIAFPPKKVKEDVVEGN